jgi:hypothetical protein
MRKFLVLVLVLALAGLVLSTGGCKKEAPATRAEAPAADARAGQPKDMKYLGYVEGPSGTAQVIPAPAPPPPPAAKRSPAIPRKLLRTVDLQLEVKDSVDVAKRVEALVNGMGGYVSSSNAQRQGELFVYSLTLRVPADRFGQVLDSLRSFAVRVNREHQQVEDVTDQYIDLDAHRRTLAETETELRGLLAESRQKGRKADEIMEIYRQLVDIRTQIEQIQTQLSSYDKLAALSTINLELVPTEAAKPVADQSWQPADSLRSSIRSLIDFLQWLVDFLIFAAVVLVPVGLAILVGFLVLRWLWRRLGRPFRRVRPVPPSPPGPPPGAAPPVP